MTDWIGARSAAKARVRSSARVAAGALAAFHRLLELDEADGSRAAGDEEAAVVAVPGVLVERAAAYVTIAGGGAQADTTTAIVSKVIKYFTDKGGNVEKATVTTDEAAKTLKVDDGTTCISCDAAGTLPAEDPRRQSATAVQRRLRAR